MARYKVNMQICRIKMRIHDISSSRLTYGIENIGEGGYETSGLRHCLREKRISYPHHACEDEIVGLVEHIRVLGNRVINGGLNRSVISIIGMAGLGKITVARKIYQNSDVKRHFSYCAWVYVSQEYRAGEVLQDLCRKIMGLEKVELEKMHREDMEEGLSNFWKRRAFPDANSGSRIIFTTHFKDVALSADPRSPPYELCLLNEEDSWELLSRKAFPEWNPTASLPSWSQELGKQIVKKCGGLPLAIVVLGGLLSRKEATYSKWHKVLQSIQWQLTQDPTKCVDILKLSYQELPFYLKSSFLYAGLFPEDYEISARKLILLWVAEGFVKPRGRESMEDVVEDYLEELIGKSMIQAATRNF
ncbi:hypothetical protein Dsin_005541 [Dipteronia sinensis]|uniref:NB-ARC domain-containing protein n=1 Tax=Dipteronia sinensis TaxID=43782 RepID=A0AAE0AY39_9ROSI|nr:hypothetical protein Dsin_005541 [Dipteronia sinensis]